MHGPKTFFEKVWRDHAIADLGGGTVLLQIDRLFLHEMSGGPALTALATSGREPASRAQVYAVIDHVISTQPGRGRNDTRAGDGVDFIVATREMSRRHGITFFDADDPRQGIVHVVSPERGIALPGLTLVCGDSHTCTVGGIGALAWGIGSTECEHVLATQTLAQGKPRTMRVSFEGALAPGVFAKDMILALIGRIGANGGIGYAVEFAGSTVRAMPVEGRLTICNMAIEFQAKYGFVAPDETTIEYLRGREFAPRGEAWDRAVAYWRTLPSDPGAAFDAEISVDVSALRPQVTWGTSPQQVAAIDAAACRSSTLDDPGARRCSSARWSTSGSPRARRCRASRSTPPTSARAPTRACRTCASPHRCCAGAASRPASSRSACPAPPRSSARPRPRASTTSFATPASSGTSPGCGMCGSTATRTVRRTAA